MLGAVVPMDVFLCAQKAGEGVFARAQPHVVFRRRRRAAGECASAALAARSTQYADAKMAVYQGGIAVWISQVNCPKSHEGASDVTV